MKFETFKFIMTNKEKFCYNDMAGTASDNSKDANAGSIDPNDYLSPIIGGSRLTKILVLIALVLVIIYLVKLNFKNG